MYTVIVMIEDTLRADDARKVTTLHEELVAEGTPVTYHVLLPVAALADPDATRLALGGVEMYAPAAADPNPDEPEKLAAEQATIDADSDGVLRDSVQALIAAGATATGELTHDQPVAALVAVVKQTAADEVIIFTQPHVVAEFFHTDWTSKARRHLDVPVLHLFEHDVTEANPDAVADRPHDLDI